MESQYRIDNPERVIQTDTKRAVSHLRAMSYGKKTGDVNGLPDLQLCDNNSFSNKSQSVPILARNSSTSNLMSHITKGYSTVNLSKDYIKGEKSYIESQHKLVKKQILETCNELSERYYRYVHQKKDREVYL